MIEENKKNKKKANKRGIARLRAVQAIYQMEITNGNVENITKEYMLYHFNETNDEIKYLEVDKQWFYQIVAGVVKQQTYIDPLLVKYLPENWRLDRLDILLRAILRAAIWELLNCKDIPKIVVINEYVDIANAFFEQNEIQLVNGILHNISQSIVTRS